MKKIIYLFGAGATHAEIMNSEADPNTKFDSEKGLLISDVSKRVMKRANRKDWFKLHEKVFASKEGNFNIELFISLLESNNLPQKGIQDLKDLIREDITTILSDERKGRFYLHKALLELHNLIKSTEDLLGFISLNYDEVLDEAYSSLYKKSPGYCLTSRYDKTLPLLKLHGSFNWKDMEIYGRRETVPIIPLGLTKNYLTPPYNFIWGRAYELLTECEILRVIGCSMNQNDIGLIDLLFKAHRQRQAGFEIQIIDFQPIEGHHQIKNNYGFLPNIVDPEDLERRLITDETIRVPGVGNPFRIWLIAKARRMVEDDIIVQDDIPKTQYLKKLLA